MRGDGDLLRHRHVDHVVDRGQDDFGGVLLVHLFDRDDGGAPDPLLQLAGRLERKVGIVTGVDLAGTP